MSPNLNIDKVTRAVPLYFSPILMTTVNGLFLVQYGKALTKYSKVEVAYLPVWQMITSRLKGWQWFMLFITVKTTETFPTIETTETRKEFEASRLKRLKGFDMIKTTETFPAIGTTETNESVATAKEQPDKEIQNKMREIIGKQENTQDMFNPKGNSHE